MSAEDEQADQPGQTGQFDDWLKKLGVQPESLENRATDTTDAASGQSTNTAQSTGGAAPLESNQTAAPTIAASSKGDGSFSITGSGFLQKSTVSVRIVDDALNTFWLETTSDGQGKIAVSTGNICQRAGNVHFSAIDGRRDSKDLTGNLWSNTATAACPAQAPPDGGDDDPDPGDDNGNAKGEEAPRD